MKSLIALAMVLPTALTPLPAAAQYQAPTEAQCRAMVDNMLQFMKSVPIPPGQDPHGAQEVLHRAETIVQENRARGASECESWAAIGRLVVNQ